MVLFRDPEGRELRLLVSFPPEWGADGPARLRALLDDVAARLGVRADILAGGFGPGEAYGRLALPGGLASTQPDEARDTLLAALAAAGVGVAERLPLAPLDLWEASSARPPLFHTRAAAHALVRAGAAARRGLDGAGVNVVVVDLGLDAAALRRFAAAAGAPEPDLRGGWRPQGSQRDDRDDWAYDPNNPAPGPMARGGSRHGTMVARSILALAPRARVFDLPLLPERVLDVLAWSDEAVAAFERLRADLPALARGAGVEGPWVLCNAWGIYDRRLERPAGNRLTRLTTDPAHPLNALVRAMAGDGHHFVFGAGNGGQFEPHALCGPADIGPGRSVLGASSSPHALSVGAVRADGMWIGYSSQGPGQPGFLAEAQAVAQQLGAGVGAGAGAGACVEKPDLCAPSQFVEAADAAWLSSGTSASCAVAAGAVAALLSEGSPLRAAPPAQLAATLRRTARKPPAWMAGAGYDIRYGHGILDLEAALAEARVSSA